jgi:hypothetical protein
VNIVSNKASKITFFQEYGTTGNIKESFNNSFLIFDWYFPWLSWDLATLMYSEMETICENILMIFYQSLNDGFGGALSCKWGQNIKLNCSICTFCS